MGKINESYIKAKELIARKFKTSNKKAFEDQVQSEINRLPPGQRLVTNFPVLDLGYQPMFFEKKYRFFVKGLVENPVELTWEQLKQLPKSEIITDFHCVTRWSKFDVKWGGVMMKDIIELVQPSSNAKYVVQHGLDDYTTNTRFDDLMMDNCMLAYELDGAPLPREHGGPIRMIIPHLYAWKGSKFITGLEFLAEDEKGFWEVRGYSNTANPWKEERYSE